MAQQIFIEHDFTSVSAVEAMKRGAYDFLTKPVNLEKLEILAKRALESKTLQVELDRVGPTSIVADGPARIVMAGPGPAVRFVGTHQGTASPATVRSAP